MSQVGYLTDNLLVYFDKRMLKITDALLSSVIFKVFTCEIMYIEIVFTLNVSFFGGFKLQSHFCYEGSC